MTWLRKHRWTILAIAAGLVLRLYFIRWHTHIEGDSLIYGDLATNILKHHIYGVTEAARIRPTLIRLPGYPLLLATCFAFFGVANYISMLYVQLAVDLGTCLLIGALARRLMGQRAGIAAVWLAALCPFTANYVAAPLTETAAIFCAALAFFSLERWQSSSRPWRWVWPLGFALAFAVLLRPDRILLAAAVLPALAWITWNTARQRSSRPLHLTVVVLILLLPLAGWAARNWQLFHVFQPLAPKSATDPGEFVSVGFQRWYRTWAIDFKSTEDVYWNYDSSPLDMADLPNRAFDTPSQRARTAAIYDDYNKITAASPAVDKEFADLAAQRVAAHPLRYYIELPILRVANMWLRPRTEMLPLPDDWWRWHLYHRVSIEIAVYAALNLAYLILAALGLWRWRRQQWTGRPALSLALVGFVMIRTAMLLTVDNSEPRYTIDCFPVVILLAAFAFTRQSTRQDGQPTVQQPSYAVPS